MKDEVTIRLLKIADLDQFFAVFSELVQSQFPEYSKKSQDFILQRGWSKQGYKQKLEEGRQLIFGAFSEDRLVAVLDAEPPFAGVSLCVWLMVAPEFQHKHIGKRLLDALEEKVKELGGHNIYLYADPKNRLFYEKMGFECIGMHKKGYFGQSDYIFSKGIQEPIEENFLK